MGLCAICQTETEHHCPTCPNYLCPTCKASAIQSKKAAARTAMCGAVTDAINEIVDNNDIIQLEPEE